MRVLGPNHRLTYSDHLLSTAARIIWEKLEVPMTLSALVDCLVSQYHVSPETCASDLHEFLAEMEHKGLLRVE